MPAVTPLARAWRSRDTRIAVATVVAIVAHFIFVWIGLSPAIGAAPLVAAVVLGGVPLVVSLARSLVRGQFGADFLAGIAIVTGLLLGELLIASVVILMLSGGQALEAYATSRASSVLEALARRHPTVAHRTIDGAIVDVRLDEVEVGHRLVVLPHETCPVDGVVVAGQGAMDESYLSGEPYLMRKTAGSVVLSGAINGDAALEIDATRAAADSRFAQIVAIVQRAEERRPRIRRLADRLGGWYTPIAVTLATAAWWASGDPSRFLAVLVIATPCPLLLAVPIAIIGAISVAARRGILIKDAAVLEDLGLCKTVVFDKTGTLTLGRPGLTEVVPLDPDFDRRRILGLAASLEQYSKHPLAPAVLAAADGEGVPRSSVAEMSEQAGRGLRGVVDGLAIGIAGRIHLTGAERDRVPPESPGLECVVFANGRLIALLRFRDLVRPESAAFVGHLHGRHGVNRLLLVSGDREAEVREIAARMHIADVRSGQTPEQKLAIVVEERRRQPTLFVGDGVNDAPAMVAANAAVALGQGSDVTSNAAGAVVLDGSLTRVDELLHIARRTRRVALQSALGGMALSLVGIGLASVGLLPALAGAVAQEIIDVAAVLNALRASFPPRRLTDFD